MWRKSWRGAVWRNINGINKWHGMAAAWRNGYSTGRNGAIIKAWQLSVAKTGCNGLNGRQAKENGENKRNGGINISMHHGVKRAAAAGNGEKKKSEISSENESEKLKYLKEENNRGESESRQWRRRSV